MKRASFVYFARPVGQSSPVKIGYSESPSASDMIRLDEVLSNPVAHAQTQEERFPKPRAVA